MLNEQRPPGEVVDADSRRSQFDGLRKGWMIPFVFAFLSIAPVDGQSPVGFEVASVKRGITNSEWLERIRHISGAFRPPENIDISGRRVHIEGISMKGLINEAYGIDTRLIVGPSWVTDGDILYEVEAVMPEGTTKDQLPAMFQSLLAQRFHFSFHRETVPQLNYALVRSRGELKLKPPSGIDPSVCPEWQSFGGGAGTIYQRCTRLDTIGDGRVQTVIWQNSAFGPNTSQIRGTEWHQEYYRITMQQLASLATQSIGSPRGPINGTEQFPGPMVTVVDRTGLEGQWRVVIDQDKGADTALPSLVASLNRLGLGLERVEVPVEKIVIDRVDKDPTPN